MEPTEAKDQWAIVEIMGHVQTAGRITRPSDWGGLLRVDVPEGDGFRTEFYGISAIYSVKLVSEKIARAYATPQHAVQEYDAPIVTREQHQAALASERRRADNYLERARELERRLTAINALPAPMPAAVAAELAESSMSEYDAALSGDGDGETYEG